jgi:hypothetical protein
LQENRFVAEKMLSEIECLIESMGDGEYAIYQESEREMMKEPFDECQREDGADPLVSNSKSKVP